MRKGGIGGATLALFALGGCAALSPSDRAAADWLGWTDSMPAR